MRVNLKSFLVVLAVLCGMVFSGCKLPPVELGEVVDPNYSIPNSNTCVGYIQSVWGNPSGQKVVAGTCSQKVISFTFYSTTSGWYAPTLIPIDIFGASETDIGHLTICDENDIPVSGSVIMKDNRIVIQPNRLEDRRVTKNSPVTFSIRLDVYPGAQIGRIKFKVDPAKVFVVSGDIYKEYSVSGVPVESIIEIVDNGKLVCSVPVLDNNNVINGGYDNGVFRTTLKGKLRLFTELEDVKTDFADIYIDVNCPGHEGIFIERVRIIDGDNKGSAVIVNNKFPQIFIESRLTEYQFKDWEIEADLAVYNRELLPEISIKVEIVPHAVGIISNRVLSAFYEDNVSGNFAAISVKGFLPRDILHVIPANNFSHFLQLGVNRTGVITLVSLYRDVEVRKFRAKIRHSGGLDPRNFVWTREYDHLSDTIPGGDDEILWEFVEGSGPKIVGGDNGVESLIQFELPAEFNFDARGSVGVTVEVSEIEAYDIETGQQIHTVGLPVTLTMTGIL